MEGTRPPTGASPTQPFNAVKMLKSKSKTALVLTLTNAEINKLTLILKY